MFTRSRLRAALWCFTLMLLASHAFAQDAATEKKIIEAAYAEMDDAWSRCDMVAVVRYSPTYGKPGRDRGRVVSWGEISAGLKKLGDAMRARQKGSTLTYKTTINHFTLNGDKATVATSMRIQIVSIEPKSGKPITSSQTKSYTDHWIKMDGQWKLERGKSKK